MTNQTVGIVAIICGVFSLLISKPATYWKTMIYRFLTKQEDENKIQSANKAYFAHSIVVGIGLIFFGLWILNK